MKLKYLKSILEETGTTSVEKVYFDRNHIVNTERDKDYPYVFWDWNTYRSILNWSSTAQQKEAVTMTAYCIGYYDLNVNGGSIQSVEEAYDEIREAFREYLGLLNVNGYIDILNMAEMPNELFPIGITVDAEIGVSFEVKMKLYCNVSPTS